MNQDTQEIYEQRCNACEAAADAVKLATVTVSLRFRQMAKEGTLYTRAERSADDAALVAAQAALMATYKSLIEFEDEVLKPTGQSARTVRPIQIPAEQQMNVDFDVMANEAEIAALKALLVIKLGPAYADAVVKLTGGDNKGTWYNVRFPIRGPGEFDLNVVHDWLASVNLKTRPFIDCDIFPLGQNGVINYAR